MKELKNSLSSYEYQQWIAYYEVEPFGFDIENARSGVIASTMANIWRSEKNKKHYSWLDFFPGSKIQKSWKDLVAIFKGYGNS